MRPWSWSDPWVVWSVSPDSPPGSWPGRSTRTPPCSAAPFSAPSVCGGWRWLTQSWPSPAAAVWIFEGQVWREIGWWAENKISKEWQNRGSGRFCGSGEKDFVSTHSMWLSSCRCSRASWHQHWAVRTSQPWQSLPSGLSLPLSSCSPCWLMYTENVLL